MEFDIIIIMFTFVFTFYNVDILKLSFCENIYTFNKQTFTEVFLFEEIETTGIFAAIQMSVKKIILKTL